MEFLKSKTITENRRFSVEEASYKDDNGNIKTMFHVISPEAVVILPITKEGKIVFVKQQRTAIGKTVIELPAGKVDPGEKPEETAPRELYEETGYIANNMQYILSYYPSNGLTNEKLHFFLTEGLEEQTSQNLTEDEDIDVIEMTPEEAIELITNNKQDCGHTLIALLWYKAFKMK